jgi:hypothetical protein
MKYEVINSIKSSKKIKKTKNSDLLLTHYINNMNSKQSGVSAMRFSKGKLKSNEKMNRLEKNSKARF